MNDDFDLKLTAFPLAEAWVCSCHPDGPSLLSAGETLEEVLEAHIMIGHIICELVEE